MINASKTDERIGTVRLSVPLGERASMSVPKPAIRTAMRCQYPEKLKGSPEKCTAEQISECHPNLKEHPCVKDET